MSEVIELEARRRRLPRAVIGGAELAPQFHCMRCETGFFRLYTDGRVHCGGCGAWLRNLTVTKLSPASPA